MSPIVGLMMSFKPLPHSSLNVPIAFPVSQTTTLGLIPVDTGSGGLNKNSPDSLIHLNA